MKKNILSILVIALCAMNVIMTAILVFVVVPTSSKTNKLISQVASVINLELESKKENDGKKEEIPLKNKETKQFDGDYTLNLAKTPGDDKDHYGVTKQIALTLNIKDKTYKTVSARLDADSAVIIGMVTDAFGNYTKEEMNDEAKKQEIRKEIVKELQTYYDGECIIDVTFGNIMYS